MEANCSRDEKTEVELRHTIPPTLFLLRSQLSAKALNAKLPASLTVRPPPQAKCVSEARLKHSALRIHMPLRPSGPDQASQTRQLILHAPWGPELRRLGGRGKVQTLPGASWPPLSGSPAALLLELKLK